LLDASPASFEETDETQTTSAATKEPETLKPQ
jgi:hypothetical protein